MIDEKYLLKNEHYQLDEFEFKNGAVLKDVDVDYGVVGTPKYDEEGNIINAVLFGHGFEGNYASIFDFDQLIGQDAILTKDDYFFISITSLGFPESCSPSTTGLNQEFPQYEIEDLLNFKKQFLEERFPNIKKIHGIIGHAFGGYEALAWSIFYPEDVDFIINFSSSYKTTGYKYIFAKIANQIIENSSSYHSKHYDESISKVLISISQLHYLISFTEDYFNTMSVNEIDLMMDNFAEDGLFYDIHDIKLRNDFLVTYDLQDKLDQIKCKVLIIGVNNIAYYTLDHDFAPLNDFIKHSKLVLLDVKGKTNSLEYIYQIKDDIKEFMDSI
ncbi:MAG: alpha/beta fold hydrolase [Methanobrevibacter sp.]|nr:alpha/beta fold hydrolase [Methanobrevibacter sp.]